MGALSGIRLFGGLGVAALTAFLLWAAWSGFAAKGDLKDLRADVAACDRAAAKATEPADRCSEAVKGAIVAARMGRQCDVALASANRDATRFAIQSACSTAVKAEVAARSKRR